MSATGPQHNTADMAWNVQREPSALRSGRTQRHFCICTVRGERTDLQRAVLMAVDAHVPVAVAVEGGEHDAEGPGPVTEQHEQAVSQRLLGEDGPPLVNW